MLPMGWQAHADDAGRIYYVNLITEESSWDKPTEHAFKSTYLAACADWDRPWLISRARPQSRFRERSAVGSTPNPPPLNQDDEEDGKDDDDDDDVRSPTDAAPARTNSNYADSPVRRWPDCGDRCECRRWHRLTSGSTGIGGNVRTRLAPRWPRSKAASWL